MVNKTRLKILLSKIFYKMPGYLKSSISSMYLDYYLPVRFDAIEYLRFYNFIKKSQWWPRWKLKQYQVEKLKKLLRYAYNNVPYYTNMFKKINLAPEDIKSIDDLKKIPILSKELLIDNLDNLISRKIKKAYLKLENTSGSTGKPMQFYRYCPEFYCIDFAFRNRRGRWININKGDKYIQLWSRPFIEGGIKRFYLYNPLTNGLSLSTIPYSLSILGQYIELIKQFKPIYIIGNPSMLYHLACYAQENDINDINFRYFISLFENLFSFQREKIEKQFKCQVYNQYSLMERVITAFECPAHEGMHIEMERGILEIIEEDGQVLPEGEQGHIVATGLHNYAMPLIRYETGDIGSISKKTCSCGRGLPLLKSLDGRVNEALKYNNKVIYSTTLSVIIWQLKNIKECQFIQEKDNKIMVNVVKRNNYSENDTRELIKTLQKMIDDNLHISINFVDYIPRTKMGKFPFIISKVKPHG